MSVFGAMISSLQKKIDEDKEKIMKINLSITELEAGKEEKNAKQVSIGKDIATAEGQLASITASKAEELAAYDKDLLKVMNKQIAILKEKHADKIKEAATIFSKVLLVCVSFLYVFFLFCHTDECLYI